MALRGRLLVGSRPVDGDFVRRFVASAAGNGIDVFRLHDPLNDVSNLREAAEAIEAAGREFDAGLVYSPGKTGETDELVEQARKLPELGAARVVLNDPTGALQPHRARELVTQVAEASGLPVGVYCQGAAGNALAAALEAARAGADRPDPRLAGAAQRPLGEPLPDARRRAARPPRRPLRLAARPDRPDRQPRGRAARGRGRGGGGRRVHRGARVRRGSRGERGGAPAARAL